MVVQPELKDEKQNNYWQRRASLIASTSAYSENSLGISQVRFCLLN